MEVGSTSELPGMIHDEQPSILTEDLSLRHDQTDIAELNNESPGDVGAASTLPAFSYSQQPFGPNDLTAENIRAELSFSNGRVDSSEAAPGLSRPDNVFPGEPSMPPPNDLSTDGSQFHLEPPNNSTGNSTSGVEGALWHKDADRDLSQGGRVSPMLPVVSVT